MEILKLTWNRTESIRDKVIWTIVESLMPIYIFLRRNRPSWSVTKQDLQSMPSGSLGREIGEFYREYNLDIMPKLEFHDAYHILFNMVSNNMYDEMRMQFVVIGNGKFSLPYFGALLLSIVMYPEYWGDFREAYLKGKNATRFYDLDLEQLLTMQTSDLRHILFLNN